MRTFMFLMLFNPFVLSLSLAQNIIKIDAPNHCDFYNAESSFTIDENVWSLWFVKEQCYKYRSVGMQKYRYTLHFIYFKDGALSKKLRLFIEKSYDENETTNDKRVFEIISIGLEKYQINELISSLEKFFDWDAKASELDFEFSKIIFENDVTTLMTKPDVMGANSKLRYVFYSHKTYGKSVYSSYFLFNVPQTKCIAFYGDEMFPTVNYFLTKDNANELLDALKLLLGRINENIKKENSRQQIIDKTFK